MEVLAEYPGLGIELFKWPAISQAGIYVSPMSSESMQQRCMCLWARCCEHVLYTALACEGGLHLLQAVVLLACQDLLHALALCMTPVQSWEQPTGS